MTDERPSDPTPEQPTEAVGGDPASDSPGADATGASSGDADEQPSGWSSFSSTGEPTDAESAGAKMVSQLQAMIDSIATQAARFDDRMLQRQGRAGLDRVEVARGQLHWRSCATTGGWRGSAIAPGLATGTFSMRQPGVIPRSGARAKERPRSARPFRCGVTRPA